MSDPFDRAELDRFRAWVRGGLGFQLVDGDMDALSAVLRDRIQATGSGDFATYLRRLAGGEGARTELRAVAARVTVGETYFFRNPDQLAALADACIVARARSADSTRTLRVLSAGCASGEEAYTVAILVREHIPDSRSWTIAITGIDVNASLLEKAKRARYSTWALRQTPDAIRSRYFRAEGRELVLADEVRGMVRFEERNLLEEDAAFWRPSSFDVILFRNVLIYLSPDAARTVVARLAASLAPGGDLFLGDAETLRNVSHDFHLRHSHGAFYYQLKGSGEARAPLRPSSSDGEVSPAPIVLDLDASWVDAIQRASDRIATLAQVERPSAPVPSTVEEPAPARPSWDLTPVTELLRQERFADALDHLRGLPAESVSDPDVQLLRAALLTNRGSVAEAEEICGRVLELDELNAGAHYLKALCREHAGDRAAAVEHDRTAVYLDPTFAMPYLHLGLLAKRTGDLEAARLSLQRAQELLGREEASRVLLFGGGFNRDALVLLSSAELRACQNGSKGGVA